MRCRLTCITFALAYFVVVFGAFVRLSDAGLSCPDWPGCYGNWYVSTDPAFVSEATEAFPDTPLHPGKALVEMVHRYAAGILGVLILALAVSGFRVRRVDRPGFVLSAVLVPLLLFQAGLGMLTVTRQLDPVIVVAHLLGGMFILSLLWSLVLGQKPGLLINGHYGSGMTWLVSVGMIAILAQITLGGWTSANYAALACPDFPACHGSLLPPDADWRSVLSTVPAGDGYLRLVAIQMVHRYGAFFITCLVAIIAALLWYQRFPGARRWAALLIGTLAIQWFLGIAMIFLQLPLIIAVLHNAIAAAIFLIMVTIFYSALKLLPTEVRPPVDKVG